MQTQRMLAERDVMSQIAAIKRLNRETAKAVVLILRTSLQFMLKVRLSLLVGHTQALADRGKWPTLRAKLSLNRKF